MSSEYITRDGIEISGPDSDGDLEVYDRRWPDGFYLSREDVEKMLEMVEEVEEQP